MKILFVCRHNTSRSILAEAIARKYLPAYFEVASGGSDPRAEINPAVSSYIEGLGLLPGNYKSTSWEERLRFHPDIVITVCDSMHGEACPNWLADGIRVAWDLEPMPPKTASIKDQLSQCDRIADSLISRIEILAETDFESMTRSDIRNFLGSLTEMK